MFPLELGNLSWRDSIPNYKSPSKPASWNCDHLSSCREARQINYPAVSWISFAPLDDGSETSVSSSLPAPEVILWMPNHQPLTELKPASLSSAFAEIPFLDAKVALAAAYIHTFRAACPTLLPPRLGQIPWSDHGHDCRMDGQADRRERWD